MTVEEQLKKSEEEALSIKTNKIESGP